MNKELYEQIKNADGTITYKPYDISKITICGHNIEEIGRIFKNYV